MKAADLVALASAHGIDLKQVAGSASDTEGVARQRRRTRREVKLGLEVVPTVRGSGSRVYRRPAWSAAELGQSAQDVPRLPWLAARYSIAGDNSGYKELHRGLTLKAFRMAEREDWPWRVTRSHGSKDFYIEPLGELVLDVEAHLPLFTAAPSLYAWCMGVDEAIWNSLLSAKYEALQREYKAWVGHALRMIQRWLLTDEEVDSPQVA